MVDPMVIKAIKLRKVFPIYTTTAFPETHFYTPLYSTSCKSLPLFTVETPTTTKHKINSTKSCIEELKENRAHRNRKYDNGPIPR